MEIYRSVLVLLSTLLTTTVTINVKESEAIQSTDICEQSGLQLFCKSGYVLKIKEVICLPYNYTCPERPKVVRLCDGRTSCSSIGLEQQFSSFCQENHSERSVIINYECEPVGHDPPCRTNICSKESEGLQCKDGFVIHVIEALCSDGDRECSWKAYSTLYGICETKQSCHASGLRPLMPKKTCDDHFIHKANVFVDYICVQNVVVHEECSGNVITMTRDFGIVKSPGFPNNPYGNTKGCFWAVYPARDQLIEVTIHLSFSREVTKNCNSQFLQITHTDCSDVQQQRKITDSFCKAPAINVKKRSCGTIYINSSPYPPGEDRGNRFLVSYQVKDMRSMNEPSYARYRDKCITRDSFTSATSAVPNLGNMNHHNSTDNYYESSFHPWRFLTLLKVVVVNIFLFIIAMSLVIAIIWVCYRYRQVSKIGKYSLSNQSDTDSGRRTNDTPLQTFSESASPMQGNSMHSFNCNERSPNTYASLHSEDPYATVDRSQYYPDVGVSTAENENRAFTSFMAPRDDRENVDPYASYSSLNYEVPSQRQQPQPQTYSMNIQPEVDADFPPPPEELQQNNFAEENNIPHYTINDDDYAIVQKPRKQQPKNSYHNHFQEYDLSHSASHRPYSQNQFQAEVGYLPQHRCMLEDSSHVCNIPPPPRTKNSANNYRGSSGPRTNEYY